MKNKIDFSDADLEKIVRDSIIKTGLKNNVLPTQENLSEAYVAQQKSFKQVSELVSQKTKQAHADLYKNWLESLNSISAQLDAVDKTTDSANSKFANLKTTEARCLNAVWLHELYFANCFDPHSEITMDSKSYLRIERDFGTFDDWQKDFIACAMSSQNGWAICGYNMFLQKYTNTIVTLESQDVMIGFYPTIVVDVHEHAYARDYLADKKSFVISQMREFNWNVIEERFNKADQIASVLK